MRGGAYRFDPRRGPLGPCSSRDLDLVYPGRADFLFTQQAVYRPQIRPDGVLRVFQGFGHGFSLRMATRQSGNMDRIAAILRRLKNDAISHEDSLTAGMPDFKRSRRASPR